jgi:hypothetical protein
VYTQFGNEEAVRILAHSKVAILRLEQVLQRDITVAESQQCAAFLSPQPQLALAQRMTHTP